MRIYNIDTYNSVQVVRHVKPERPKRHGRGDDFGNSEIKETHIQTNADGDSLRELIGSELNYGGVCADYRNDSAG